MISLTQSQTHTHTQTASDCQRTDQNPNQAPNGSTKYTVYQLLEHQSDYLHATTTRLTHPQLHLGQACLHMNNDGPSVKIL